MRTVFFSLGANILAGTFFLRKKRSFKIRLYGKTLGFAQTHKTGYCEANDRKGVPGCVRARRTLKPDIERTLCT
ncbi:MAG: hypothetical protein HQL69_23620 [Magnetococcales bacterium]|nr:hypothetical protein [Magnetococcales bacterium]